MGEKKEEKVQHPPHLAKYQLRQRSSLYSKILLPIESGVKI